MSQPRTDAWRRGRWANGKLAHPEMTDRNERRCRSAAPPLEIAHSAPRMRTGSVRLESLGGLASDHVGPQGGHERDCLSKRRRSKVVLGGELFVAWSPVER